MARRIEELLAEREARRAELEQELESNAAEREAQATRLERVTVEIDELAEQRDELEDQVLADLGERPEWIDALAARDRAAARSEQAQRRLAAATEERDDKLPAYRAERLFAYLLDRGYGTPTYRGGWLARRLDAWVARKVEFESQFDNYRLIDEFPNALAKELERQQPVLDKVEEQVRSQLERQGAQRGLPEVLERGEALMQERHTIEDRLGTLDEASAAARTELTALDADGGSYYAQALAEYRGYLEAADHQRLAELAAVTISGDDDQLVRAIGRLEEQALRARDQSTALGGERRGLAAEAENLRGLERDFTVRGFDAANSRFKERFDIEAVLAALLGGSLSLADAASRIAAQQYFKARRQRRHRPVKFPGLPGGFGGRSRRGSRGRSSGSGGFGGGFGGWGGRSTGGFGRR